MFDSLQRILGGLENQVEWRSRQQFQLLLARWAEIVGAAVAAQTRPVAIRRDILQVATSSAVWSQNLMFERRRILEKLNAQLPYQLSDIRFSTALWHSTPNLPQSESEAIQMWQNHPSRIASKSSVTSSRPTAVDPGTAFQQWATQVQARSQHLPLCPACQCPTPDGELQRWSVCALCATKNWQSNSQKNPI